MEPGLPNLSRGFRGYIGGFRIPAVGISWDDGHSSASSILIRFLLIRRQLLLSCLPLDVSSSTGCWSNSWIRGSPEATACAFVRVRGFGRFSRQFASIKAVKVSSKGEVRGGGACFLVLLLPPGGGLTAGELADCLETWLDDSWRNLSLFGVWSKSTFLPEKKETLSYTCIAGVFQPLLMGITMLRFMRRFGGFLSHLTWNAPILQIIESGTLAFEHAQMSSITGCRVTQPQRTRVFHWTTVTTLGTLQPLRGCGLHRPPREPSKGVTHICTSSTPSYIGCNRLILSRPKCDFGEKWDTDSRQIHYPTPHFPHLLVNTLTDIKLDVLFGIWLKYWEFQWLRQINTLSLK